MAGRRDLSAFVRWLTQVVSRDSDCRALKSSSLLKVERKKARRTKWGTCEFCLFCSVGSPSRNAIVRCGTLHMHASSTRYAMRVQYRFVFCDMHSIRCLYFDIFHLTFICTRAHLNSDMSLRRDPSISSWRRGLILLVTHPIVSTVIFV